MRAPARYPPVEPTAEQAARVLRADEALARSPDDLDALVEAALAREEIWRYEEAVAIYTRGMELAPEDYRMPLGRAHRLLRLRRVAEAEADLDRARELDPYGFNTAYLGALARYLQGRYDDAVAVYRRALAASEEDEAKLQARGGDPRHVGFLRTDPATRAAFTAWYYRALRRARRDDEAAALLETIDVEAPPGEPDPERFSGTLIRPDSNEHYFRTLLFYRGVRPEEEVLDREELGAQWTTVAYGVAVWHLLEGAGRRARSLYREIVAAPHWARLGHVAAEADLKRL